MHSSVSKVLLYSVLLFNFILSPQAFGRGSSQKIQALAFDWDNTVMNTNSRIHVFNRQNANDSMSFTTAEFAEVRDLIGNVEPYSSYKFDYSPLTGSFREFADREEVNVFRRTIQDSMATQRPEQWQGPSWQTFINALNDPEKARWVSIITARGHSPEQIHEGLELLAERGYIKYLPPVDYIFTVGGDNAVRPRKNQQAKLSSLDTSKTEDKKVQAMEVILDDMQEEINWSRSQGKPLQGEFIFFEDDKKNVEKAREGLKENKLIVPDINLFVTYVGSPHAQPTTWEVTPMIAPAISCKASLRLAR